MKHKKTLTSLRNCVNVNRNNLMLILSSELSALERIFGGIVAELMGSPTDKITVNLSIYLVSVNVLKLSFIVVE